jgi:hypothetical protein
VFVSTVKARKRNEKSEKRAREANGGNFVSRNRLQRAAQGQNRHKRIARAMREREREKYRKNLVKNKQQKSNKTVVVKGRKILENFKAKRTTKAKKKRKSPFSSICLSKHDQPRVH